MTNLTQPAFASKIATTSLIAWKGEGELIGAAWSLGSGRTVEFRIVEKPGIDRVNPFKQYTRKRGGHVGQIFATSICEDGKETTMYDGDVMLAGWGDSHDKGQWVRFWLDEEADRHPFAGFNCRGVQELGTFFVIALVLLDQEGQPIDPAAQHLAESQQTQKKGRTLSQTAHLMVTSQLFVQYLREKSPWTKRLHRVGRDWDSKVARDYVKFELAIESLSDIDRYPEKAELFHRKIREPYAKWSGAE